MHVLVNDGQGRLALRRLSPWQRVLARGRAARLDRELAQGALPEASVSLAARAARLTSTEFRRALAASLRRILVAAGEQALPGPAPGPASGSGSGPASGSGSGPASGSGSGPASGAAPGSGSTPARSPLGVARPLRVPVRATQISRSAPVLAELAGRLLEPGPVPVCGVAMVAELLADGTGPLYREASRRDLDVLARRAAGALTW
jgi:hypothetical protein